MAKYSLDFLVRCMW